MSGVTKKQGGSSQGGFTLIELLVVIAIIGLISSIVLASLGTAKTKGVNGRIQADVHQYFLALELYYTKNGYYPLPAIGVGTFVCLGKPYPGGTCWTDGNTWTDDSTLDTALTTVIPGLPIGQTVTSNNGHTYVGYVYKCKTQNPAGTGCIDFLVDWTLNGAGQTCSNDQGHWKQDVGNASQCEREVTG